MSGPLHVRHHHRTPDDIAQRACEIVLGRNGDGGGDATADWLQAERELATRAPRLRRRASATA